MQNAQIRIEKSAKICLYYCFKKLTKVIFHIYIMPVCFVCSNTNMLNFQPVKERMGRMRKRKRKIKLKRRGGGQIHCAPLVFAQGIYWTVATYRRLSDYKFIIITPLFTILFQKHFYENWEYFIKRRYICYEFYNFC